MGRDRGREGEKGSLTIHPRVASRHRQLTSSLFSCTLIDIGVSVYADGTRYEGAYAKDKRHGETGGKGGRREGRREGGCRFVSLIIGGKEGMGHLRVRRILSLTHP